MRKIIAIFTFIILTALSAPAQDARIAGECRLLSQAEREAWSAPNARWRFPAATLGADYFFCVVKDRSPEIMAISTDGGPVKLVFHANLRAEPLIFDIPPDSRPADWKDRGRRFYYLGFDAGEYYPIYTKPTKCDSDNCQEQPSYNTETVLGVRPCSGLLLPIWEQRYGRVELAGGLRLP